MPMDRLMRICLECDHCRITFNTEDIDFSDVKKTVNMRTYQIYNRDRIKDIWCAKGVIRDTDGVPRVYHSQTALKSARYIEGTCPFFSGEEDADSKD